MITAFLYGLAELLADDGHGSWKPPGSGVYAADDVGISIQKVPQKPDNLIVLSAYPVQDDAELTNSILGVQIRTRGDQNPTTVLDRDHAIFVRLQGMREVEVGGMWVALMWRQSGLPGPQDENDRWERSSNYYVHTNLPTLYRTE